MANNVDTRIVEMEFDNDEFQSGAKETLSTISKLNSSLQFDKLEKSFNSLSKAASNIDFSGLKNVGNVAQQGFSAMESIAYGAFQRIGYKASDLGMQIANELLFAQKRAGFAEYELELGSVQTIQASSGKSFDEIYGYLGELNKYSDQTIYSFSDMTSSIGKFTNAGVDLEVAVKAIQGISNEAAISGANANEASRAMYNFAQALSSGFVALQDWKSIELANMGTLDFKQQLIDTALALGTVVKQGDKYVSTTTNAKGEVSEAFDAASKFNATLGNQWLTSEVLIETLGKYSDQTTELGKKAFAAAQDVKSFSQMMDTLKEATGSGWSETFRLIFGEFEDAKKLWTGVSNTLSEVIDAFSELRNHALRYWTQEEGRTKTLEALIKLWEVFSTRIRIVSDVFQKIFPEINQTGHKLVDLTNGFSEFADTIDKKFGNRLSLIKFQKTCMEVFTKVQTVLEILHDIAGKVIKTLLGKMVQSLITRASALLLALSAILTKILTDISNLISAFQEWSANSENLKKVEILVNNIGKSIENLAYAFVEIYDILRQVVKIGIEAFTEVFSAPNSTAVLDLSEGILTFAKNLKITNKRAQTIKSVFKAVFMIFKLVGTVITAVVKGFAALLNSTDKKGTSAFTKFANKVEELVGKFINFLTETNLITKAIKGIGAAFSSINQFIVGLTGKSIIDNLLGIFDFFISMGHTVDFEGLGKKFKNFGKSIADGAQNIWTNVLHLGDENSGPAKLVEKIKDLKEAFDESGGNAKIFGQKVREGLEDAKDAVKKNVDKIISFFVKLKNTIAYMADAIRDTITTLASAIAKPIVTVIGTIAGEEKIEELKKSETFFADLWINLEKLSEINSNKKGLKTFGLDKVKSALETLNNGLKEVEWLVKLIVDSIFTIQLGIGLANFGIGVKQIGKGFKEIGKGINDLTSGVVKVGKNLAKAKKLEALSGLFVSFAAVLLVLFAIILGTTAIFVWGKDDVIQAFVISVLILLGFVALLGITLGSLISQLDKLTKDNDDLTDAMESLAKMLIGIAIVMGSFAVAVAILGAVYSKLGPDGFTVVLVSIIGVMSLIFLYIAALVAITSKSGNVTGDLSDMSLLVEAMSKLLKEMGFAMIEMAAAMWIIAKIPDEGFKRAAITLVGMFVAIGILVAVVGGLAPKSVGSNFDYLADIIKALGGTIIKLAVVMAILTLLAHDKKGFKSAIIAMVVMLGGLALIVGLAAGLSKHGSVGVLEKLGDLVSKIGIASIMFAAAIAVIANALALLKESNVSKNQLGILVAMVLIMGVVLAGLALLTKIVPGGGVLFIAIAGALLILSAAMLVLAYALDKMAKVDFETLAKGFKIIGDVWGSIMLAGAAFLVLGLGCVVLGVGILALVVPFAILMTLLGIFMTIWPKFEELFTDFDAKALANTLFEAFVGALEALASVFTKKNNERVAKAIVGIVTGLLGLIAAIFKEFLNGEVGADIIQSLIDWAAGVDPEEEMKKSKQIDADYYQKQKMIKAGYEIQIAEDGSEFWALTEAKNEEEEAAVKDWEKRGYSQEDIAMSLAKMREYKKELEEKQEATKTTDITAETETKETKTEENKDSKETEKKDDDKPYTKGKESGEDASVGFISGLKGHAGDITSAMSEVFGSFDFKSLGEGFSENMASGFSGEDITNKLNDPETGEFTFPMTGEVTGVEMDTSSLTPTNVDVEAMLSGDSPYATDFTSGDFGMGETSTEMSQETNATVNAALDEETKTLYSSLKQAVEDLNAILDGVTIVSDEATLQVDANIDGETAATAIAPFADVLMTQSRKKAKAKQAQTYPGAPGKKNK